MKNWKFGTKLITQEERVYGGETIKVVDVPGDGNCLFYSVTQQLSGMCAIIEKKKENNNIKKKLELIKEIMQLI